MHWRPSRHSDVYQGESIKPSLIDPTEGLGVRSLTRISDQLSTSHACFADKIDNGSDSLSKIGIRALAKCILLQI